MLQVYPFVAVSLCAIGLYGLIVRQHLLRRILAFNVLSSGIFLLLIALAARGPGVPDPVPQAMVLTGIVVAVSATALALTLARRLYRETGATDLRDEQTHNGDA